jgi:acyl-coenzyme A thioesterase PaaI-like protein
MKGANLVEKLLKRDDRLSRIALDNLMRLAIPFNAPHGFKFTKLAQDEVQISLPNFKLNHNHLGGMHACSIATLGEFCAGMTIVKQLGMSRYRLILAELSVKYHLQGRTALRGVARLEVARADALKQQLAQKEKVLFEHNTEIYNTHNEKIADVRTVWQIKDWKKVQLK